jgi:mono/diheme cytochrome c family protein
MFLAGALVLAAGASAKADPAAGAKVFEAQKCVECHYTDGPAKEKAIADQLAKKGPELWYAGSKFQQAWLESWLQNPEPIRIMAYNSITEKNPGDHPKLSGGDATSVTEFLMSLASKDVEAGVIKPKKNLKGKLVFTKKMPCTGCHQYPGRKDQILGGLSGPTLVGAGNRLNPDWIYAYLKTPNIFKPVKAMPTFAGILSDKDMRNVATFVSTLK